MSLSTRITLLVLLLLATSGAAAGYAFYGSVRRTLQSEAQGRVAARLAWLQATLEVDLDETPQVELHPRGEPADAEAHWRVDTHDGRVLWSSAAPLQAKVVAAEQTIRLSFGDAAQPAAAGAQLVTQAEHESNREADRGDRTSKIVWGDLPDAVSQAVTNAVPGLVPRDVEPRTRRRKGKDVPVYRVHGDVGGRGYRIDLTDSGEVLGVEEEGYIVYHPPKGARVDLELAALVPVTEMERELAQLSRSMWTVGPMALAATGLLLVLLIRWQFRPLARMARQAAAISPTSPIRRIGPVGASRECVRLRESINGMVHRLATGLERERQFAASAAHELRTPLAQMRTTAEVALRKQRDAGEYRDALAEVLADVERLQGLIAGLLQLAADPGSSMAGAPSVSSQFLLDRLRQTCGPVTVPVDLPPDVTLAVDPALALAAVSNVLENARRYAPGEPPAIRIESGRDRVMLVVADGGPGIPEADRQRIFEPLTRLDAARTIGAAHDGFGLGLAIARATMQAFGGDLACRARVDGRSGAEFVFTFRRAALPKRRSV